MDSLDELLADLHSATSSMKVEQGHSSSNVSTSSGSSLPTQAYQTKLKPYSNDNDQYHSGGPATSPRSVSFNDPKLMSAHSQRRYNTGGDAVSSSNSSRRDSDRYSVDSGASGDGIAPPLPPPPSQEVIDEAISGYIAEPLYEPQNVLTMNSGHSPGYQVSHSDRGSGGYYPTPGGDRGSGGYYPTPGGDRGSGGYYPTPGADRGSGGYYPSPGGDHGSGGQHPAMGGDRGSGGQTGGQSSLGANLNELDYLLQDLNSAQFMEEIGSSASDGSSFHSPVSAKVPPATLPKPGSSRSPRSPAPTFTTSFDAPDAHPAGHASSATRELEDLMDSLSQFKVEAAATKAAAQSEDPPYAQVDKGSSKSATPTTPPKPSELDNMLGNLESDMRGHGVSVSTKGLCGACAKPIVGQVITALGRIWHPAHFCCHSCKTELGTKSFFERDEMPYCEECYHRLFAPLCGKCDLPILDKCVTAMDSTWHMQCFVCEHCGRMLNDEGFHERAGVPYCRNDYLDMFAPKCGGCQLPIVEDFISTLNTQWHPQCFRCKECGVTLAGGSFFDHDGLPYCETHYYAKRGSLCAGCQKPITGRCITAMFRKFHPEHFTCAFCLKQLNKGTFKEQNDKPYCHPCFIKLFA